MPQVEVSRWQIGKPFTWNELLALRNGNSVFHKKFGIGKVLLMHRQSLVFNKVTIEVAYNDRIRLHDIGRVNDMLCHVVRVRK
jgi:transcription elongation factor GreA-like protein